MATIQINEDYRLASDSRQWKIEKKSTNKNTGDSSWSPIRYYTTLQGAAKGAHGLFLRLSDADGISEMVEKNNEILEQITSGLKTA